MFSIECSYDRQGVSGCGKSTIASALAESLSLPFIEADKLHPQSNIDKMSAGTPLTDADREPWLELIRKKAEHACGEQEADSSFTGRRGVVIACSALKRYYRDILRGTCKPRSVPEHMDPAPPRVLPTFFVFIKGDRDVLMERMGSRKGHFMKAQMLDSQLQTLESPEGEDGCIVVQLTDPIDRQVEVAREGLVQKVVGKL